MPSLPPCIVIMIISSVHINAGFFSIEILSLPLNIFLNILRSFCGYPFNSSWEVVLFPACGKLYNKKCLCFLRGIVGNREVFLTDCQNLTACALHMVTANTCLLSSLTRSTRCATVLHSNIPLSPNFVLLWLTRLTINSRFLPYPHKRVYELGVYSNKRMYFLGIFVSFTNKLSSEYMRAQKLMCK